MKKRFLSEKISKILLVACLQACILYTNGQHVTAELSRNLLQGKQGTIVNLPGVLSEKLPLLSYQKIVLPGPQFLFSDDPEYIKVPEGIAFQEDVQPGTVRLYVYNVNGINEPQKIDRKIIAVIKNTGNSPMHLRMLKYSSQKPSTNYFAIGKNGLADFFASKPGNVIHTINAGEVVAIDTEHERNVVKYDELVHGLYEFVIDQPGEISVVQTDLKSTGAQALKRTKTILPPKSKSGAGRGVYGVCNYDVKTEKVFDTKDGVSQIMLADGNVDPWIMGYEKSTGAMAMLEGNYGVMYNVTMKWKSTDGKGLALVIWNSRSDNNEWCGGMAASMIVSKGKFKGGIIQLPSDELITKKYPEGILVQLFPPAANGEEQTIHFTYSPPGASCLPTPLVLIPVDMN